MARSGMDIEAVEQVGQQLKARAGELQNLIAGIESLVQQLPGIWEGQDSQQFVNEWWPQHKTQLVQAQQQIDGLGTSAINNATDQRAASSR